MALVTEVTGDAKKEGCNVERTHHGSNEAVMFNVLYSQALEMMLGMWR